MTDVEITDVEPSAFKLEVVPLTLEEANNFVERYHRQLMTSTSSCDLFDMELA